MYAIVDIAGQQFKVETGQKIFVHQLDEAEGNKVDFDKVLLIDNDGSVIIGEPHIGGAFIEGKVLEHTKGDKVIVFKKKRRKGYKVKKGHRQQFSQVEIISINEKGYEKKAPKAEAKKEEKVKTAEVK
ncbi:MAG: 50S ribosomal protein L21, partial [Bacteroidales bacterium]|nr:50S ribosomal protein L21 [Bacteroidales bacterium]